MGMLRHDMMIEDYSVFLIEIGVDRYIKQLSCGGHLCWVLWNSKLPHNKLVCLGGFKVLWRILEELF